MTITNQPRSQTVISGESFRLSVGVGGGAAFYQWYKANSGAIPNATNSMHADLAYSSADYYVVVTNVLSLLTSQVAKVTVIPDTVGPKVVDARGDTNTYASRRVQAISIAFPVTDPLLTTVSTNPANFAVYAGTNFNTRISFTNVSYTFTDAPRLHLWMTGWVLGGNYFVVLNGVADGKGNLICPNTRVPVSWVIATNFCQMTDPWDFHDVGEIFDPGIYSASPAWNATNYVASAWWQRGPGPFWYDPFGRWPNCLVAGLGQPGQLGFQNSPTLFRRTFLIRDGLGANGVLWLKFVVDDGLVLYLNGKEVYVHNTLTNMPVTSQSRARDLVRGFGYCTNRVAVSVNNLLPGTNWLAAAVVQGSADPESDIFFGIEASGDFLRESPVPADPPRNQLLLTMTSAGQARAGGKVVLSWPAAFGGFCLQYKTNLNPDLPWISVSNQANPYTNPLSDVTRLFRLSK